MTNEYDPQTAALFAQWKKDEEAAAKAEEAKRNAPKVYDPRGSKTTTIKTFAAQQAAQRTIDGTPNWQEMILQATDGTTKMKIRAAREAWQDEQKFQAHQAQQAADQSRVDAIKNVAVRNKEFWDSLSRTDGRVYWSTDAQRLMRADKTSMGLAWYSKGRK